jgi:chromate reductase, NAD(P)H dehydrogenase (quinone)
MKILGLIGSLRRDSYNAMLMRAAGELLPPGVELVIFDELREIPAYDEDLESDPAPRAVTALKEAIAEADGILIATPEYNGSVPGFLKNALDWVSRPFEGNPLRNKPAAVMGASTGMFGAVWAQAELRKVLGLIGARAIDRDTPIGLATMRFGAAGELTDDDAREAVGETLVALVESIREREAYLSQHAA